MAMAWWGKHCHVNYIHPTNGFADVLDRATGNRTTWPVQSMLFVHRSDASASSAPVLSELPREIIVIPELPLEIWSLIRAFVPSKVAILEGLKRGDNIPGDLMARVLGRNRLSLLKKRGFLKYNTNGKTFGLGHWMAVYRRSLLADLGRRVSKRSVECIFDFLQDRQVQRHAELTTFFSNESQFWECMRAMLELELVRQAENDSFAMHEDAFLRERMMGMLEKWW